MTILAQLLASNRDTLGYITYVFRNLEDDRPDYKYIMAVRYPNWDHRTIELGDIGYLQYVEIRAGVDKWFDGKNMIPYNYNTIQFIKFVEKPNIEDKKYIM